MDSPLSQKACGSVSLPCSPDSDFSCPPVSYCDPFMPTRRRSSISRARENIRKTSTKVQHQFERKLLQMAELHMDVTLPLHGAPGVIYHVIDMPKEHSRDTVIGILDQSIEWLRTNKDGSTSPFIPNSNSKSDSEDLLTSETEPEFFDLPPLEPSTSQDVSSPQASQEMEPVDRRIEEDEEVFADFQGMGSPTPTGTLINLESQPVPDSLTPGKVSPPPTSKKDVHPDLASLISFFEKQSTTSTKQLASTPRVPRAPQTQRPSPQTQNEVQKLPSQRVKKPLLERATQYSETPTFRPYRPSVHRKPIPTATPTTVANTNTSSSRRSSLFLGAGLRPVLPPSLTITPAPPVTATSSTEFLDRKKNPARLLGPQESSRRKIGVTQDEKVLEPPHSKPSQAPVAEPIQPTKSTQPTTSNKMAERISQFEKPLPELPRDLTGRTRTLKRSTKRLGDYGAPQLTDTTSSQTKNIPPQDDKKYPVGGYQPYRPSPTPQPPTTTVTPPSLPQVPHLKKGSMLQEIKNELFANSGQRSSITTTKTSSTISNITTNTSLLQVGANSQDATKTSHKEPAPTTSHINPDIQTSYLPYSPTQIRKGTLKALGGKVVEIRKQFEPETKPTTTTADMPLFSRTQNPSDSKQRRPSTRHHEIPTRTSSAVHTRAHTNAHSYTDERTTHNHHTSSPSSSRTNSSTSHRNATLSTPLYRTQSSRDAMSLETRQRLIAAADEADFASSWRRAVDTGRDSEVIRKLDFAIMSAGSGSANEGGSGRRRRDREWEWKRFVDVEWDDRERERQGNRRERVRERGRDGN